MKTLIIALGALLLIQAQQPPSPAGGSSVLERYVGDYIYPDGGIFKARLDGGALIQEAPGRKLPFTQLTDTMFMLGPVFTAEFVTDNAGGMTLILSDGAGVEYRLRRKGSPPEAPVPPPAPVPVPAAVLERYVGVYEYIPGQMQRTDLRIRIRLKDGKLLREMGPETELIPLSETKFRVAGTSLVVEFVVDEAGVTQILGTGFQQMLARLTSKR